MAPLFTKLSRPYLWRKPKTFRWIWERSLPLGRVRHYYLLVHVAFPTELRKGFLHSITATAAAIGAAGVPQAGLVTLVSDRDCQLWVFSHPCLPLRHDVGRYANKKSRYPTKPANFSSEPLERFKN